MEKSIYMALLFSFLAGVATSLGGLLSFVIKKDNFAWLAVGLGFSAGVMLYVSFVEMLPHAQDIWVGLYGLKVGSWWATGLFFAGITIAWCIDRLIPLHHVHADARDAGKRLKRLGLFTAMALAIHNFPEGLLTFMSTMESLSLGVSIAVAVAIHNIPEGIAVALPVYHATGSKMKAFWYSSLSGLSEPVGAVAGFFLLYAFLHESTVGVLFGLVAGIMVYIALDELLPAAHEYDNGHAVIGGVIGGMALMALSLMLVSLE